MCRRVLDMERCIGAKKKECLWAPDQAANLARESGFWTCKAGGIQFRGAQLWAPSFHDKLGAGPATRLAPSRGRLIRCFEQLECAFLEAILDKQLDPVFAFLGWCRLRCDAARKIADDYATWRERARARENTSPLSEDSVGHQPSIVAR